VHFTARKSYKVLKTSNKTTLIIERVKVKFLCSLMHWGPHRKICVGSHWSHGIDAPDVCWVWLAVRDDCVGCVTLGYIVAVDSVSPTVFCISETGDLIRWFDCSDYMREPSDIAVSGKEYFVCDFKVSNITNADFLSYSSSQGVWGRGSPVCPSHPHLQPSPVYTPAQYIPFHSLPFSPFLCRCTAKFGLT